MYVYREIEQCLWTVGFYTPDGKWESESDHRTPDAAAKRVSYLNGGGGATADDISAAAMFIKSNW